MTFVRRSSRLLGIGLGMMMIAGATMALSPAVAPAATEPVASTDLLVPSTVVSLGDNGISGEGAGSYESGTNGENGNWCHRSTVALVHKTKLSAKTFNLACSGAKSVNVSLVPSIHNTEGSQAERLIGIASDYRVTTVIVRVGSNDDPQFSSTVVACMGAYLYPERPDCATALRAEWPTRLAAMAPKVKAALLDVKTAMANAGYSSSEYKLVVTSYASPITEKMTPSAAIGGCPFRLSDARWARTEALPQLNAKLSQVASEVGARFLDLTRATENREACSRGSNPAAEWQTRLTVDPYRMVNGQLTAAEAHKAAESFHLNAAAHAQLGTCMTEFVDRNYRYASCVEGTDGVLHAVLPSS
jgi:GDSL-like Lipase/Acylhydrolase family